MMISPKSPYTPDDVGYDAARLETLNAHFLRMMEKGELQSANYCLSRDGKTFAQGALGKLSFRADDVREVRLDTIQWIASITKLFTATAMFKLVEDGAIRLCQPVGEILPEMATPPFNGITLAHLLSHTSGLNPDPGCFENKYFKSHWDYIAAMPDKPWLEAALSGGLRSKPGAEWAYSTFGFVVLGEVISRVSGVNCHDFIAREILEPCGMADTFFPNPRAADPAIRARMAAFARRMNAKDEDDEKKIAALMGDGPAEPSPWDAMPRTGGGLWSTAADLNRFGVMLLNGGSLDGKRILGRRAVARMTELYTGPDVRDFCWGAGGVRRDYALGPDRRRTADSLYSDKSFFHEGAGGCCLIVDPEERLVASWFVPFTGGVWRPQGLYNASAIIWSGLK
jgi:CubicO group peptidase (beta-lactamase class C family)